MPWWNRKRKKLDEEQREKISASQKLLLDAAISTADMAQFVTAKLKQGLEDAIKQFEATAAIMIDALLMCDAEGKIKACNPAASKIFGYVPTDIMKKSSLDLLKRDGGVIAKANDLWSILKPECVQDTFGLTGVRASGENFPVEVTMTRLGRADGSVIMLMLIRDISNMMALKKEAEDNAKRYRSLVDLCFDGILVVQKNVIVAANHQAGALFGVRPESLLHIVFNRLVNHEERSKLDNINTNTEPVEANALRGDGTPMSLLFSGSEIVWNDDKARLITVRDLSRRMVKSKVDDSATP